VLEPFLDLMRSVVAGFDRPFIKPDVETVVLQSLGDGAHDWFVFRAVA
jgi:hypothetical protein